MGHSSFVTLFELGEGFKTLHAKELSALMHHNCICQAQSAYMKGVKLQMPLDNGVCLVDFTENYSFIIQDAIKGFHWNASQATMSSNSDHEKIQTIKHTSYTIISDVTIHDNASVYAFQ
jgi:hypothetical protein